MYKLTIVYKNKENLAIELCFRCILIDVAESIVHNTDGAIGYKITENNVILDIMSFDKKNIAKIVNA